MPAMVSTRLGAPQNLFRATQVLGCSQTIQNPVCPLGSPVSSAALRVHSVAGERGIAPLVYQPGDRFDVAMTNSLEHRFHRSISHIPQEFELSGPG
jgi:hypothetical protein